MELKRPRIKYKKAIIFSLISVLFSVLFITLYSQKFDSTYEDRMPGSNIRIKVLDIYTRNFETYASSSIRVSSYKTLDAITNYSRVHGFFGDFDSFNRTFYNCMLCGTTNCSGTGNDCGNSQDSLKSRLDNISILSQQELNIKTEYVINSIEISQDSPFEVLVKANISYNITDYATGDYYARWSKEKVIEQSVPIIGLLDPEGFVEDSTGNYKKRIKIYTGDDVTAPCEFDESCWNYDNTRTFYRSDSFRYFVGSTSFLQRYWDDNSPSYCCGIESIIHPSQLGSPDTTNSYIDHYYWDNTHTCANGHEIIAVMFDGDNVSLDGETAARYHLTDSGTLRCAP